MIPLPPKVKLVLGVLFAGLLAAGGYWEKAATSAGLMPPLWLPPVLAAVLFVEGFLTIPPSAANALKVALAKVTDLTAKMGGMSAVLFLAGFLAVSQPACKGVQFPSLTAVEQVVFEDLAICGDTTACRVKMENDVATLIAQGLIGPEVGTDALVLVRDALQILADMNVIPQNEVPKARAVLQTVRIKLAAPAPGDVPVGE